MPDLENSIFEVNKLEGLPNFTIQKFRVQTILEHEDLWGLIEPLERILGSKRKVAASLTLDGEALRKHNRMALSILKLLVKDQVVLYIMNVNGPKECWDTLKSLYGGKNNANRLIIHNKFSHFQMEEGTYVGTFL